MVGSVTIGDNTYSQIRLMPEIVIWKFGFGLDIDLLIDSEGKVRKEDWDEAQDIINKIYYIRFAQRKDPFLLQGRQYPGLYSGSWLDLWMDIPICSAIRKFPQYRRIRRREHSLCRTRL